MEDWSQITPDVMDLSLGDSLFEGTPFSPSNQEVVPNQSQRVVRYPPRAPALCRTQSQEAYNNNPCNSDLQNIMFLSVRQTFNQVFH